MIPTAPKFGKVELLIRTGGSSRSLETFEDCGLMITGDYIIVIIDEKDDINNTLTSTGNIFNLKDSVFHIFVPVAIAESRLCTIVFFTVGNLNVWIFIFVWSRQPGFNSIKFKIGLKAILCFMLSFLEAF